MGTYPRERSSRSIAEFKGAFLTDSQYEDLVSATFRKCKDLLDIIEKRGILLGDLKSTASLVGEQIREDYNELHRNRLNST